MPLPSKKVHIIKVPNEKNVPIASDEIAPSFDRMPRMYLELLENKEKIKPNLVNREYDPEEASSVFSFDMNPNPIKASKTVVQPTTIEEGGESTDDESEDLDGEELEEKTVDGSDTASLSDRESDVSEKSTVSVGNDDGGSLQETDSQQTMSSRSDSRSEHSSVGKSSRSSISLTPKEEEVKNKTKKKLQDMLFSEDPSHAIPSLSELKRRGEVKDVKSVANFGNRYSDSHTDEEDELKRELLFKFEVLKKAYKNVPIPEFTMHSDYRNMNQTYENTLRQVSLDSNVESYKSLLVGGFMLLEFILGHWMKFDMSGFTQQQILNMNQYERLLIELGEKSYTPGGSQWPVEVRLLGLIIMNAVIFIISKLIMKSTGNNLVGLMNSVNTVMNNTAHKPKRKMRGPSVDIDAIPEVQDTET